MDASPKEIELKLRVAPEDIAILKNHPNLSDTFHDPIRETLKSVYYDSDNRFLRDHGLTLRIRHIGDEHIQTIKTDNRGSDCFERSEWEQAIEGNQPDLSRVTDTALRAILTDEVRKALKQSSRPRSSGRPIISTEATPPSQLQSMRDRLSQPIRYTQFPKLNLSWRMAALLSFSRLREP